MTQAHGRENTTRLTARSVNILLTLYRYQLLPRYEPFSIAL